MEQSKRSNRSPKELLREILENLRKPQLLDDHPWAIKNSLEAATIGESSGEQLVQKTFAVFRKMTPNQPPRVGKRLDTQWGVFGILAAQYFYPFQVNKPFPTSLKEAWHSMDDAILYFAFGQSEGISETDAKIYRFAGNELEPLANSTLSDWHRKGIEQLAEMIQMESKLVTPSQPPEVTTRKANPTRKILLFAFAALAIVSAVLVGLKGFSLYQKVQSIRQKAAALEDQIAPSPKLEKLPEVTALVHELRVELDALQIEAEPYLWAAPYFGWIPKYGGTIRQAEDVLVLAQNLATAADEGLTAVGPAIETALLNDQPLEAMDILLQLQSASPQLLNAQVSLAKAQEARNHIDPEQLIPSIGNIITNRIDPLFSSLSGAFPMEDALTMVRVAPTLLGSGKAGPQTYLILMQNEDELRPTGGYLTAAGSAVVMDGKLISIKIESSELIDDLSKPYPIPPRQFEEFMNIEMFLFRDSNWFTNFPTTASWAEYFYSYSRATSSDGVIAIDMQTIVRLLKTLGSVEVEGVEAPITDSNVLEYMRSAEETRPPGVKGPWDRKQFISRLAEPLLKKILNARGQTWTKLAPVLVGLLEEKHILVQMDDADASTFLEKRGWDGAVHIPENSDFLMVVDANMGYNKSNAIMETSINYQIDLSELSAPSGYIQIQQNNLSKLDVPCTPFAITEEINTQIIAGIPYYNINECHWGYLRVYTPEGTNLVRSNPKEIPAEATLIGQVIPARTDDLGDEDIPGAQVFGMMVITPTQQSTVTEFEYILPETIISQQPAGNGLLYRLKIQKQPGIAAYPLTISFKLPAGAQINNATIPLQENSGVWSANLELIKDVEIEVGFTP